MGSKLYEKSLKVLELPEILNMLSAEAVSESAKEMAQSLIPLNDIYDIKRRLEEATAAKDMMVLRSSPPFSGVKDIRATVKRADMGGTLNIRELLDVAALLRTSSSAMAYLKEEKNDVKTAIDYLFNALNSNKPLEHKISSAIISEEEIADTASSELSDIRRHMRLAGEKIRQTLNKIITSQTYSKVLQEPIITIRNGRYVVPVKAEHKAAMPGLVHDISSSGATQFVEPMSVVNINNELRELEAREKQEVERILAELSADVAACADDLVSDFEVLVELDLVFAKAKLSYKLDAVEPEISDKTSIRLNKARHPLLAQNEVVPIDIHLGVEFDTLVITGPNTGGKTVALKTLGLLCAMAQCGLHIPVSDESVVPIFGRIFADIGDEQSIEQSLSTFSSHMVNIVNILEECDENSLLLFDELGAGTDPTEGAALAIAIIEYARGKGSLVAGTTHYTELKTYAITSQGVANASCEFDIETLKPTYRLIIGIPGKSNAFAISQRLGLPDTIIEDAKKRIDIENIAFEDALASLETTRITLETQRREATKLLRDADIDRKQAEEYRKKVDWERDNAVRLAKREAASILDEARRTAESVLDEVREIQRKAVKNADFQSLNEDKVSAFRKLNEAQDKVREVELQEEDAALTRDIVPGDKVKLRGLGVTADVISVDSDGNLSLQAGIMKVTARTNEVILVEKETQKEVKKYMTKSNAKLRELAMKPELDLRGMNIDDALPMLERFLDNARLAKLHTVTVIHGKGTGVLRKAVHQALRREKRGIKSFRLGRYGEGEDGVTIIELT